MTLSRVLSGWGTDRRSAHWRNTGNTATTGEGKTESRGSVLSLNDLDDHIPLPLTNRDADKGSRLGSDGVCEADCGPGRWGGGGGW